MHLQVRPVEELGQMLNLRGNRILEVRGTGRHNKELSLGLAQSGNQENNRGHAEERAEPLSL